MTVEAIRGSDILLYVNTGTELLPVWEAIAGQRGMSFDRSAPSIDASSKDHPSTRVLPGRYGGSITLDALYLPTHDSYIALNAAMVNREFVMLRRYVETVATHEVRVVVTSISEPAPDNEVATISVDFDLDGDWTELGS